MDSDGVHTDSWRCVLWWNDTLLMPEEFDLGEPGSISSQYSNWCLSFCWYAPVHTHTHRWTHAHTNKHTRKTHRCMHTYRHTCIEVGVQEHTHTHTHTHIYKHTHMHAHAHTQNDDACTHTHTDRLTRSHTHTHTYRHLQHPDTHTHTHTHTFTLCQEVYLVRGCVGRGELIWANRWAADSQPWPSSFYIWGQAALHYKVCHMECLTLVWRAKGPSSPAALPMNSSSRPTQLHSVRYVLCVKSYTLHNIS